MGSGFQATLDENRVLFLITKPAMRDLLQGRGNSLSNEAKPHGEKRFGIAEVIMSQF
jgi:hypothetical protein